MKNNIESLKNEKDLLLKELKVTKASSRKEEIIDRILAIEHELSKLSWVKKPTLIPSPMLS